MAIKFLSGLNLSNVTAGSILKLDSNGNIVAAVDGTDYNTAAGEWSTAGQGGVNINKDVRIGTFSSDVLPEARLHVYEYQTTDPKLLIEDGNTGDASMEFKISSQSYTMGIDNSDSDKFILAASTALGTTNVLEVATNGSAAFQKQVLFNETINLPGDGTTSSREVLINAHGNRGKLMKEGNATYWQVAQGGNQFEITDAANGNDTKGNVMLRVHGNDANDNEIYLAVNGGKVGVGTTDPTGVLHVAGTYGRWKVNGYGGMYFNNDSDTNNTRYIHARSDGALSIGRGLTASLTGAAPNEYFATSFDQLYIKSDGNVGIGTTSPDSKLHIEGTTDGTGAGADAILHVKQNGGWNANQPWALYVEGYSYLNGFRINANDGIRALHKVASGGQLGFSVTDTAPITFTQSNSTERMRVHTNGNIGIGTASPGASLHVASTTNDFVAKFSHSTATGYAPGSILLEASQATSRGQGIYHYNTNADESWFTGVPYNVSSNKWIVANKPDTTFNPDVAQLSHALLTIEDNGRVGIGTTSPEEKLHVIGNIKQNDFIMGRGAQHIVASMPDYYKIAQVTIDGTYGTSHRLEGTVSYGGDNEKSTKIDFWVSFRSGGNLNVGTPLVRYGYRVENLNVASSNGFESGSVDTAFRVSKTSDTSGGNKVYEIQFSPNDANYINAHWEVKYSDYGNQGSYPTTVYSTLQSYGTDIADSNILKSQDSTRVDNNTWITQLGVGSSNNTSYSFYNNNTSYFNGSVTVDANLSMTGGGYITTDSSNALTLRSDVQHGQGDEDAVISFKQSTTELGKFDQDGYLYAAGFKKSGTTGFLKSDGTVDTTTLGTMASAATSDYKTSDATETYVATELASYTATTSFGTNAFTSFSDHSTQGYLTALPAHNHNDIYYTETELNGFFKSLTHQGNYISTANWSNDGSGTAPAGWSAEGFPFSPTGGFNQNGSEAENTRTVAELPNGAYGVVWRTPSNDAASGSDGGWDMDINNVQHAKAYRSVVYFQKTDDSTSGTFYHGCHGSHTLNMDGSANSNPYFHTLGFSNLEENRWYVSIGYIQPYQYPTATNSTRSGIYDCYTGKKIQSGTDYMMKSGSTTQRHRTYQYYSTDPSSSINWWSPRFEEINGNEPSLAELIQRVGIDGELGLNFHSKFPAGALASLSETTDATNDKILLWDESADEWKQMTLEDLQDSIDTDTTNFATAAQGTLADNALPKAGGTMTGALTITHTGDGLTLQSATDGTTSAGITFTSQGTSASQKGHVRYNHRDGLSYGSAESFTIGGTEATTTILADGKLMYAEGIYSKPSSGTGGGTRRDANWNTAYTYSQVGHLPLAGGTVTGDVVIAQSNTSNHWALKISTNGSNNSGFWTTNEDVRLLLRDNSGNIRVDLYPDSTSRFYDSVQFDSTITHNGVDLTSGTSVDQITEFPMTFQLEGNTWTDTGIDGTDLSTGTYTMQVYVSDFSVGGQHYYEYYSATISWYSGSTNSTVVDEIPVHRAGHAPNAGDLQFRTQRASGTDSHDLMLQVKTNSAYTGELDNSSGGKIMRFKFRRLM